ncbi:MAG: hypothetical protein ABI877_16120 [Gemmatimonadaceae bacterium]
MSGTPPANFAVARAYLDQLARGNGLSAERIQSTRDALGTAERAAKDARRTALSRLATQLDGYVSGAADASRVRSLAGVVKDLARTD